MSTPRFSSSLSMKCPKRSSPHTPTNVTFNPSRAAPDAKMADEEPIVRAAESTSFSVWSKPGITSPERIKSGLISPATRISKVFINHLWTQRLETLSPLVGLVPIEGCLGGIEICIGFGKGIAEGCEPPQTIIGLGAEELDPFLAVHHDGFLPNRATHSNATCASAT